MDGIYVGIYVGIYGRYLWSVGRACAPLRWLAAHLEFQGAALHDVVIHDVRLGVWLAVELDVLDIHVLLRSCVCMSECYVPDSSQGSPRSVLAGQIKSEASLCI